MSSITTSNFMEKIAFFVDGTNFYISLKRFLKEHYPENRDFEFNLAILITHLMRGSEKYLRTYFYINDEDYNKAKGLKVDGDGIRVKILGIDHEEGFSNYISVKLGEKNERGQEKRVDTLLVVEMLKLSYLNSIETSILVGGDLDFVDAITVVKDLGKQVGVASFQSCSAKDLKNKADFFISLDNLILNPAFQGQRMLKVLE